MSEFSGLGKLSIEKFEKRTHPISDNVVIDQRDLKLGFSPISPQNIYLHFAEGLLPLSVDGYLTVRDAHQRTDVSESTLEALCESEEVKAIKSASGQWLIHEESLLNYLSGISEGPKALANGRSYDILGDAIGTEELLADFRGDSTMVDVERGEIPSEQSKELYERVVGGLQTDQPPQGVLVDQKGEVYLSLDETAQLIGLSTKRLRGLVSEGRLDAIKPGGVGLFISIRSAITYDAEGRKPAGRPRKGKAHYKSTSKNTSISS